MPTGNIAFFDALKICSHKRTKARLTVSGGIYPVVSRNVIATLPGTDENGDIIYCGAHMDSVAGSVGADDNAFNNLDVISCDVASTLATVSSCLLEKLANGNEFDNCSVNPETEESVNNLWDDLYSGWNI